MAGELLLINPKRRKARKSRTKTARDVSKKARRSTSVTVRSNPIKRRRFKRNPIGSVKGIAGQVMQNVQDGAIGAGGAIATKAVISFIPLPEALKSGAAAPLVTALAGVLIGTVAGNVIGKANGAKMAQGAVTVALYQLAASQLAGKVPGLNGDDGLLGAYDMGAYDMGAYDMGDNGLLGEDSDMDGYVSPTEVSGYDTADLI